jgi:hypothetical protein
MITYEEAAALTTDLVFRGRVKIACIKFAYYILDEAVSIPAHNSRVKWANRTLSQPDQVALEVQNNVVVDAKVQESGATITDVDLQSAVETTVNKML